MKAGISGKPGKSEAGCTTMAMERRGWVGAVAHSRGLRKGILSHPRYES
jgi:hypothetical protein